jgi:hypothetical protein
MKHPLLRTLALLMLVFALPVLSGCTNPDAPSATTGAASTSSPQNAGELPAPPPPSPSTQAPAGVQATPARALEAFAQLYVNWTYRTLTSNQRRLAAMSVGPARLAEQQAAVSSRADMTITRGHIYNTGQIVCVASDRSHTGLWVIVTSEQTRGSSQYQGLQAIYHVTLAKLANVDGGYAVELWSPQT